MARVPPRPGMTSETLYPRDWTPAARTMFALMDDRQEVSQDDVLLLDAMNGRILRRKEETARLLAELRLLLPQPPHA